MPNLPHFNDAPNGLQTFDSYNFENVLAANVPQLMTVPAGTDSRLAKYVTFKCTQATAADFYVQPYTSSSQTADVGYDDTFAEWSTNGTFASDTGWTKGTGWTIAAGVATATGAISTAISQTTPILLVAGRTYTVTYTVTQTAGSIAVSLGGGTPGTSRSTSATFVETIVAGSTQILAFTGTGFSGTIDNVTVSGHTLGTGWTTASNVATATGAISTNLSNTSAIALVSGQAYLMTMAITRSAGSIAFSLGGGTAGTSMALTGTYNQIITAGSTQTVLIAATGFTGTITSLAIRPCIVAPALANATGIAPFLNPQGIILNRNVVAIDIVSAGTPTVVSSFYS